MAGKASISKNRKPHFTIISKILNSTRDRCHFTPEFTIESMENTTWDVCLTFGSGRRPVWGRIKRTKDGGPKRIQIEFELTYYDSDGSTMLRGSGSFRKNDYSGEFEFCDTGEARCGTDSATLRCCFWRKAIEIAKSELCFASTHYNIYNQFHVWAVKQFSLVLQGEKRTKVLNGITKKCPQINLNLSLGENNGQECLFVHLEVPHLKDAYAVEAETTLLDYDAMPIVWVQESTYLHGGRQIIKLGSFETRYLDCEELLSDDVLLVQCELKITTANPVWSGITDYRLTDSKELLKVKSATDFRELNETAVCPFKETVNKFKEDGTLSDVCLRAGSESFPVHKFILSSRSPVFKAMFSSNMKEKTSKCIDIPDLDADTLKCVLRYIYKDVVQELTWETAGNLFKAADKYELMALKEKCSCFLKSNLSKSNVCEILVLSDMHHDKDLSNSVQEFILNNSDIICSDVWKVFKQNHSKLALETTEQIIMHKMKQSGL